MNGQFEHDEWRSDFLEVQQQIDRIDDSLPEYLRLAQYRRWSDFQEMVTNNGIRFRRADTYKHRGVSCEAVVHERVQKAFCAPADENMLKSLRMARFLYISCFTKGNERAKYWSDFAPNETDLCIVTTAGALRKVKPASVFMVQSEYGVDWNGPNPSDHIFEDRTEYEAICSVEGLEYEQHEFSFARPLKYLKNDFRYQEEVRLVYSPVSMSLDGYSTWTTYEADGYGDEVVYVPIDLGAVVAEVVLRSDAPAQHANRVKELLKSVGCIAEIRESVVA